MQKRLNWITFKVSIPEFTFRNNPRLSQPTFQQPCPSQEKIPWENNEAFR